jgi:hypothetical protein
LAEDGACYGVGRCNWKQYTPYIPETKKEGPPGKSISIDNNFES